MIPAPALDARHRSVAGRLATLAIAVALVGCNPAPPSSIPSTSGAPVATPGAIATGRLRSARWRARPRRGAPGRHRSRRHPRRPAAAGGHRRGQRRQPCGGQRIGVRGPGVRRGRAPGGRLRGRAARRSASRGSTRTGRASSRSRAQAPLEDLHDFKAMLLSASGDVRGPIHALGFDPAAPPGDRSGLGCHAGGLGRRSRRGDRPRPSPGRASGATSSCNAQDAGAVALVTAYPEWQRDQVLRPTLVDPDGIEIPALAASNDAGLALADAAQRGADGARRRGRDRRSFEPAPT